jgi:hypothetical protein
MGTIANLYNKAKQWNILAGIIISDLIALIAFVIFPSGIILLGDLQMGIGVIIGTRFALKNLKQNQTPLKYGIIASLGGALLSATSLSVFEWTISLISVIIRNLLFSIIFSFVLEALIIGFFIGMIEGLYFRSKHPKKVNQNNKKLDELYESLKTSN